MRCDSKQYILQVGERRDVDEFAALDERIEECGATSAFEAAGEEPVLPTEGNDAELVLGPVVVDGQPAVLDEPLEGGPLIGGNSSGGCTS